MMLQILVARKLLCTTISTLVPLRIEYFTEPANFRTQYTFQMNVGAKRLIILQKRNSFRESDNSEKLWVHVNNPWIVSVTSESQFVPPFWIFLSKYEKIINKLFTIHNFAANVDYKVSFTFPVIIIIIIIIIIISRLTLQQT